MTMQCFQVSRTLLSLAIAFTLVGCTVGPHYQRPVVDMPSTYSDAPQIESTDISASINTSADQPAIPANWWMLYGDTTLDELVAAVLKNNADIHKAIALIDESEARLVEIGANILPEINLGASSGRSRSSTLTAQPFPPGTPAVTTSHRLALSTSFELDLWGKLRRASEAARADVLSTRYAKDVTVLTLAGTATQVYFMLRALDAQITITKATLTSREDALTVVTSRTNGGLASSLEMNQAQGARADVSLQLRDLQRQRALLEHQLGSLTGNLSLTIAAGDLMNLPVPALPPVGLPSTLLERRPDVQQAEQRMVATNAQIGVTRAAQLPTFSLTGNFGGQSADLVDLLKDGARIWSLGLAAALPIIDAGKYAARTRQAEARQRQSVANYQKTVEAAFREVADALTNVHQTNAALADLQIKVDAAHNALRLSRLRYEAGYSGYLDVLDSQRTAHETEQAFVQNRQAQLAYSVDLMKALGGGWSLAEPFLPTAQH